MTIFKPPIKSPINADTLNNKTEDQLEVYNSTRLNGKSASNYAFATGTNESFIIDNGSSYTYLDIDSGSGHIWLEIDDDKPYIEMMTEDRSIYLAAPTNDDPYISVSNFYNDAWATLTPNSIDINGISLSGLGTTSTSFQINKGSSYPISFKEVETGHIAFQISDQNVYVDVGGLRVRSILTSSQNVWIDQYSISINTPGSLYGINIQASEENASIFVSSETATTIITPTSITINDKPVSVWLGFATEDPSGSEGNQYWNTNTTKMKVYSNGAWHNVDGS